MASSAARLQELLRSRLVLAMTDCGWELDVVAESTMGTALIGAFRHHIDDQFSVAASFEFAIELPNRNRRSKGSPIKVISPDKVISEFGVSYDRSYRLWPLATGHPVAFDLSLNDAMFGRGETLNAFPRSDDEIDVTTEKLAAAAEKALQAAGQYTSVETIVDHIRAHDEEMDQIYVVPLLLAAAGRPDEARAAIRQYRSLRLSSTHDSEYRAFVTRLTTWLDSGSPLLDLPDPVTRVHEREWPGPDHEDMPSRSSKPGFRELWERSREKNEKNRAAIEAVRSNKEGKSREELAEMLQRERAERGLDTNPRVLDLLIDGIQAESKAEKRAAGFKALRNLADGLSATFTGISVSGDPAPPWMEPPLKASHSIRGVPGKWITVETDVEAIPVIERALATAIHNPLLDDQIQPEVWLDWQSRPSSDTAFPSDTALLFDKAFLEVHLGDQTVATLDADTTSLFRIHMETAATEGLVPVIKGRLTRTSEPPGHRLEIQSPANQ